MSASETPLVASEAAALVRRYARVALDNTQVGRHRRAGPALVGEDPLLAAYEIVNTEEAGDRDGEVNAAHETIAERSAPFTVTRPCANQQSSVFLQKRRDRQFEDEDSSVPVGR